MKEMKEKIYDARTGMEYILIGDYYLPALKVPRTRPVGRWGMLHKAYLKLRKPAYYQSLLLNGKLDAVLADVEEQAAERYEVLIEQMSQRESISEKLKEENPDGVGEPHEKSGKSCRGNRKGRIDLHV